MFCNQAGRVVGARNLHFKVTNITYETDYEITNNSGIRGRRNAEKLDAGWCLCICVCVRAGERTGALSLAALRILFRECSGGLVMSLHDTH